MDKRRLLFLGGILGGAIVLGYPAMRGVANAQFSVSPSGGGNDGSGYSISRAEQGTGANSVDAMQRRANQESDPRILEEVQKDITNPDPRVRVEALARLSRVKDSKANAILVQSLADPDTRVKVKAVNLLAMRGDSDAVPYMCQYLFLRSTEAIVKLHLVAGLGRIGDSRATLPILQYLKEAKDDRTRGTAVFALGEIGDPRANDSISEIAANDNSPTVRRLAAEAIEKIDGEIPTARPIKTAANKALIPTDQRLSKLREMDAEMQQYGGR